MYGSRYRRNLDRGRWRGGNESDRDCRNHTSLLRSVNNNDDRSNLVVLSVTCNEDENCKAHHTDEYDFKKAGLILRRGQVFRTSVKFNRPVDKEKDKLILQFTIGSRPQQSKNTLIRIQDTKNLTTSSWGMQVVQQKENTVDLFVMSPADAIVGQYSVYLEIKSIKYDGKEELVSRNELERKITILFNAWCRDDSVYMENEEDRFEYVLNDEGSIWVGSHKNPGYPWTFGQFAPAALESCLKLMEMADVPVAGNPIRFCRVISKMVNAQDDNGVLIGNWSGDYSGGESPLSWSGSVRILQQFLEYERSVKYGQCWVFSGVVTTLLRAIGIPTRSVTNFASAHDSDGSMTIDRHFDINGKHLKYMDHDSVWNFHVWNESFFTRPDLLSGNDPNQNYDGWQAHDATPQETSDGVYQCGPCPLKAIQKGEVYLPYDTGFVFAEVNGDVVYWKKDENGEMKAVYIAASEIGKFISTKAVGSDERNDVTHLYKFPEGSEEERKAVQFANQHSSKKDKDIYSTTVEDDVFFEVKTSDNVMFGEAFEIKLAMKNKCGKTRTVKVTIDTQTCHYTGKTASDLKDKFEELTISGKRERTVVLPISFDDYKDMPPDLNINVYFKAEVMETGQQYGGMDIVEFLKPKLTLACANQSFMNEPMKMMFCFVNPLPVMLKNGRLNLECPRMIPNSLSQIVRRDIGPYEEAMIPVTAEFGKVGLQHITGSFTSDQLVGVSGKIDVQVIQ